MLYEYRRYDAALGRFPDIQRRFQDHSLRLFAQHGFDPVGFWQADVGTSNELNYILRWPDAGEREKRWAAFLSDPEWLEAKAKTEENGVLVQRVHNQLWVPTAFSPMK